MGTASPDTRHPAGAGSERGAREESDLAADASGPAGRASRLVDGCFVALTVLALVCWALLFRRYSIFDHHATPHYSFIVVRAQEGYGPLVTTMLLFVLLGALYAAGYLLLSRSAVVSAAMKRSTLALVLGAGALNVLTYPLGSHDLYYYLAELKLAYYYGHNPYVVTFRAVSNDPWATYSILLDTPLAYGPSWLLLSAPPALLAGFDSLLRALLTYKAFSLVVALACGALIYHLLDGERRRWLALYAFLAHPLLLLEGVGSAHNDVLLTAFVLAALVALRRAPALVGPAFALAVGVKLLAAPLALAVAPDLARRWGRERLAAAGLAGLGVALLLLVPYWDGGRLVGGMAEGAATAQSHDSYSVVALARFYARWRTNMDHSAVIRPVLGGLFALLAFAVILGDLRLERRLLVVQLLFYLLVSSLFPWYFIPIIALAALWDSLGTRALLFLSAALGPLFYPVQAAVTAIPGWSPLQAWLVTATLLLVPIAGFFALAYRRAPQPLQPSWLDGAPGA